MIYLNFLASTSILMIIFLGVQKNIKTLNCINDIAFNKHRNNLKSLVVEKNRFQMFKTCTQKLKYDVSFKGSVTNE